LKGQLQHLSAATSTPDGALRQKQIASLLRLGAPSIPTAFVPATVAVEDRHPWAGFTGTLTVGAIGFSTADLRDVLSGLGSPTSLSWAKSVRDCGGALAVSQLPAVQILLVRCSCALSGFRVQLPELFSTVSAYLAVHRPLVTVAVTPAKVWSSTQVNDFCPVPDLIQGLHGLDFRVNHVGKVLGGHELSVLVPDEVAARLAAASFFTWDAARSFAREGRSALYTAVQLALQFLRPLHTFRVTDIEQVWPKAHRVRFAAWKEAELLRARSIRGGTRVPPQEPCIFDADEMDARARGVIWDLRAYFEAEGRGVIDPALIVPLYCPKGLPRPTKFNLEAIDALTKCGEEISPDLETPKDMRDGFRNTAQPPIHTTLMSNWPKTYEHYETGKQNLDTYVERGYVETTALPGPPFVPSTNVAANTVPKGLDQQRSVTDHGFPRGTVTSSVYPNKTFSSLSLNSRIDTKMQAEVSFGSFDRLRAKIMALAQSCLPVRIFKTDGDAWYKQFFRRLQEIADGVQSWPALDECPEVMLLFHDYRLQFGDASAAHRAYRVCYMIIWILMQDIADHAATDPSVRAWQKLQLEMMEKGLIKSVNLAFADVDGFIDDFMGMVLATDDIDMLAKLLALMELLGVDYSKKKTELPHHRRVLLGFMVDTKLQIAYLVPAWRLAYIELLRETLAAKDCSLNRAQVIGGKAIRVCCLVPQLRAYCNSVFAVVSTASKTRRIPPGLMVAFKQDLQVIHDVLVAAPQAHMLFEAPMVASIADGAPYVDTDASTSWGMGAVLFAGDVAYYLFEPWTEEEKGQFDIFEFEAIALEIAMASFPLVVPELFARRNLVARVDNEPLRFAFAGLKSSKGLIDFVVKRVLGSQVAHHFHLHVLRVSTVDNSFSDALSRGELEAFLAEIRATGRRPVRLLLSPEQRSLAAFKAAKDAFSS
jgi:hypothetical protein